MAGNKKGKRERERPGRNNKIYYLSLNIIFLSFQKIKKDFRTIC